MVVAARTLEAKAKKHLAGVGRNVVGDQRGLAAHVALIIFVDRVAQVGRADEHLGVVGRDFVPCELLAHEAVVGFVGIQAADDPVAVAPRGGAEKIGAVAVAVGVAHEVEPVLRPALAVARAREQFVHEALGCIGARISNEGVQLSSARRQAVQIEVEAAREFLTARLGRGGELQLGVFRGDKAVDVAAHPFRSRSGDHGRLRIGQGLEGPISALLGGEAVCVHRDTRRGFGARRPWRAHRHPLFEERHLGRRQRIVRRHREVGIGAAHGLNEKRFFEIARDDDCAAVPAFGEARGGIEAEPRFLFFIAVTFVAPLRQQGADLVLEKLLLGVPNFRLGRETTRSENTESKERG